MSDEMVFEYKYEHVPLRFKLSFQSPYIFMMIFGYIWAIWFYIISDYNIRVPLLPIFFGSVGLFMFMLARFSKDKTILSSDKIEWYDAQKNYHIIHFKDIKKINMLNLKGSMNVLNIHGIDDEKIIIGWGLKSEEFKIIKERLLDNVDPKIWFHFDKWKGFWN